MKTRKELLGEFKERKTPMGVFQIRNTATGKVFLDAGVNMPALWNRHRFQLELGNHPNPALQAAWRAQGSGAFVYEVVSEITAVDTENRDYRAEVAALLELCLEERRGWEKVHED